MVEVYRHLSLEEAEKLAREIYERYTNEVNKKWEQFKGEMELMDVPEEVIEDQELWDYEMVEAWEQLMKEIRVWDMIDEYKKKGVWVWIEHEEDIVVVVSSSSFDVEVRNGYLSVEPGGFRGWKYSDDWNRARLSSILRAWEGFARLFFPWALEDRRIWTSDSWLELEVYRDLLDRDAWKG